MFDLTDFELLMLGLGGAFLVGTCKLETFSRAVLVQALCFVLGLAMLAVALLEIVTDHF